MFRLKFIHILYVAVFSATVLIVGTNQTTKEAQRAQTIRATPLTQEQKAISLAQPLREKKTVSQPRGDNPQKQIEYGKNFTQGINGFPQDDKKAIYWFSRAVDNGSSEALIELYYVYMKNSSDDDSVKKAFGVLNRGAINGVARAQFLLGTYYDPMLQDLSGQDEYDRLRNVVQRLNLTTDIEKAKHLYELSANQGDVEAQVLLGVMYSSNKYIEQDRAVSKEWFGKSCDSGSRFGCDLYKRS